MLIKLELSQQIFEKSSYIKFNEKPSSRRRVVPYGQKIRVEGRTNRHDETSCLPHHNCATAPTHPTLYRSRHGGLFLKHTLLKNTLIIYLCASLLSIIIDFKRKLRPHDLLLGQTKNISFVIFCTNCTSHASLLETRLVVRNIASTTESCKESWPIETSSITHKGQREYRNRKNKGRAGKRKV